MRKLQLQLFIAGLFGYAIDGAFALASLIGAAFDAHASMRGQPLADALHVEVTDHGAPEPATVAIGDTFALHGVGVPWEVVAHNPAHLYAWTLRDGALLRHMSTAELTDPEGEWRRVEVRSAPIPAAPGVLVYGSPKHCPHPGDGLEFLGAGVAWCPRCNSHLDADALITPDDLGGGNTVGGT